MKNLKIPALAVVISAALMALAGSAAATTITSPTGTVATPDDQSRIRGRPHHPRKPDQIDRMRLEPGRQSGKPRL